jgi:hypothetical protein
MKIKTFLLVIMTILLTSCATTSKIKTDSKADKPAKAKFKKHFTQYSTPTAILCEQFTYTKYFSDTKVFDVIKTKGNLHVWGTIKVSKGAFNLTITDPNGEVVLNKEYKSDKMTTIDRVIKSIDGTWTFNITCFDTSGNYQLMAKQL